MPPRDLGPYLTAVWRVLLMSALVSLNFKIGWTMCLHYLLFSVMEYKGYFIFWGIVYFKALHVFLLLNAPYSYWIFLVSCLFVHVFNLIFVISIRWKIHSQHKHFFICLMIMERDNFYCFICSFQDFILSRVHALPFPLHPFAIN